MKRYRPENYIFDRIQLESTVDYLMLTTKDKEECIIENLIDNTIWHYFGYDENGKPKRVCYHKKN